MAAKLERPRKRLIELLGDILFQLLKRKKTVNYTILLVRNNIIIQ